MAVLCVDVTKQDFADELKDLYHYEVLGGHSNVLAEVYAGLNDEETLRLASRHNRNGGNFIHRMSQRLC